MEEFKFAAMILFMIAFPGMLCNWFIVIFSFRTKTLKNAFGRFLSSQAFGEAIHLSLFALYVAPVIFFNIEDLLPASAAVGHILLICYDICIYCHLFISINRLFAIVFPFAVETVFSPRNTVFIIVFCYTLAIFPSFYYYIIADCRFILDLPNWLFIFTQTEECAVIMWYADFMKYNIIVAVIVTIDLFTLSRVHSFNKTMRAVNGSAEHARREKELNFLKQACLQAAVFVFELITYFVLPEFFQDRWTIFMLTTVPWVGVHSIDAVITIYYNKELRSQITNRIDSISGNTVFHDRNGANPASKANSRPHTDQSSIAA